MKKAVAIFFLFTFVAAQAVYAGGSCGGGYDKADNDKVAEVAE